MPIEEISLRPELSSPARFRIQEGYPERDGRTNGRTKEILVSNLGWSQTFNQLFGESFKKMDLTIVKKKRHNVVFYKKKCFHNIFKALALWANALNRQIIVINPKGHQNHTTVGGALKGLKRHLSELSFRHVTTRTWAYSRVFGFFRIFFCQK